MRLANQQLMDASFTAGQYDLISTALNTPDVHRDPGVPGFPS